MSHDIDNPDKSAAAEAAALKGVTLVQGERLRLPAEDLEALREKLKEGMESVDRKILAEARVIKGIVARIAPRLSEIDEEVFPLVNVIKQDGQLPQPRRLLEVLGSSRATSFPFEVNSLRFTSVVAYITPEGSLTTFMVTSPRRGGRVIYDDGGFETYPRQIVQDRVGIFKALDFAAYRGVCTPKNSRPKTAKG